MYMKNLDKHIKIYNNLKKKDINLNNLYIKNAGINKFNKDKNLGVFAKNKIKKNNIIEYCPAILLDWRGKYIKDSSIMQYAYWSTCNCAECQNHGGQALIALGYGSLINSADSEKEANSNWFIDINEKLIFFYAIKNINKNQEILVWYGQKYHDFWCK